ncbi:MAG: hypothetical protein GY862_22015 [Gammaproteobacteria bacterium]|nr:hypothetical protein [Gammaproteobacteria bacterium]
MSNVELQEPAWKCPKSPSATPHKSISYVNLPGIMSAISHLYIGVHDVPLWTKYEDGETSLFEANYLVPILWFSLFCEKNLCVYIDPEGDSEDPDDNRVPMLIRRKNKSIEALDDRIEKKQLGKKIVSLEKFMEDGNGQNLLTIFSNGFIL